MRRYSGKYRQRLIITSRPPAPTSTGAAPDDSILSLDISFKILLVQRTVPSFLRRLPSELVHWIALHLSYMLM